MAHFYRNSFVLNSFKIFFTNKMDERPTSDASNSYQQQQHETTHLDEDSDSGSKSSKLKPTSRPNAGSLLFTSSPSLNDIALLNAAATTAAAAASNSPSPYSSLSTLNSNSNSNLQQQQLTPVMNKKSSGMSDSASPLYYSNSSFQHNNNNASNSSSSPINERVASLASSIYTELEKIVKAFGRDTVKDLMPIVVNVLEALNSAYHDKEEQVVENELLKDDYEKLLNQYEREKQSRKDTELVSQVVTHSPVFEPIFFTLRPKRTVSYRSVTVLYCNRSVL